MEEDHTDSVEGKAILVLKRSSCFEKSAYNFHHGVRGLAGLPRIHTTLDGGHKTSILSPVSVAGSVLDRQAVRLIPE
jgi:hypothetical protein